MTFKKGQSGNPEGRPKGSANFRGTIVGALEKVYDNGEPEFWQQICHNAKEGDASCINLLANRMVPALKPQGAAVEFDLNNESTEAAAMSILKALSDGVLSPDQAQQVLAATSSAAQLVELESLKREMGEIRTLLEAR